MLTLIHILIGRVIPHGMALIIGTLIPGGTKQVSTGRRMEIPYRFMACRVITLEAGIITNPDTIITNIRTPHVIFKIITRNIEIRDQDLTEAAMDFTVPVVLGP